MPLRLWMPRANEKEPSRSGTSTSPKCITLVPSATLMTVPMIEVSVRITVLASSSRISSENTTSSTGQSASNSTRMVRSSPVRM